MKKTFTYIALIMLFTVSYSTLTSCKENKSAKEKVEEFGEDIEEGAEDIGDDIEEGVEEIEDEIDDATDDK